MGKNSDSLDKRQCEVMADSLDKYLQIHYLCIVRTTPQSAAKYEEAVKTIEKARDRLRDGKIKHVIKKSMIDLCLDEIKRVSSSGG